MLADADTIGFLGVELIVVMTPGPDMALVTAHALGRGRGAAMTSAIGVNAGILVHAAAAALGLSALLVSSSVAFTLVKLVGAGFLLFLGIRTILDARRTHRQATVEIAERRLPSMRMSRSPFWQGFWSNVLNPKVALRIFLAMGLVWLLAYAAIAARMAGFFRSERVRRRIAVQDA